jgi:hypothetical protein
MSLSSQTTSKTVNTDAIGFDQIKRDLQISTDLKTISDSKRVMQISTYLKKVGESRNKEKSIAHGINHTPAAPDPTPTHHTHRRKQLCRQHNHRQNRHPQSSLQPPPQNSLQSPPVMSTILAGGHHLMPRQNITPYHTKSPPELQDSQILPDPKQTSAPRTESNLTHCQSAKNQTKLPDPPPARKQKTTERIDTVGTTERTEQKTKNNWW